MHRNAPPAIRRHAGLLALLLVVAWPAAAERSHPREGRLTQGEAVWLDADDEEVFAVLRRADRSEVRGGVLLIGGRGEHPEAPGAIAPLRRALADHGWVTLAMARADAEESSARLRAGLNWLVDAIEQGERKLVIIGHEQGALDALAFLDQHGDEPELHALVLINTPLPGGDDEARVLAQLEALERPVLDIFFRRGPRAVVDTADERRRSVRRGGNEHYRQDILPGTGRDSPAEGVLTRRIQGWLTDPEQTRRKERDGEEVEHRRAPPRSEQELREETEPADNDDLRRYFTPPGGD